MVVPTYDKLLACYDMEKSIMKQMFHDKHLREFSLTLDTWEKLARFLEIPNPDRKHPPLTKLHRIRMLMKHQLHHAASSSGMEDSSSMATTSHQATTNKHMSTQEALSTLQKLEEDFMTW